MKIIDLEINKIKDKHNIRQITDEQSSISLMQSIKDNGLFQPIGVVREEGEYFILWGNRRLIACKKLGWKTIPSVLFRDESDIMPEEDFIIINAQENLQQKTTTLYELGRVCKELKKKHNLSVGEIATRLSLPKNRIENGLVELSRIPEKWQRKTVMSDGRPVKSGYLPVTSVVKASRLRKISEEQKEKIYNAISKDELTLAEVSLVGALMKDGLSFDDAKIKSKNYKAMSTILYIDVKKMELIKNINNYSNLDIIANAVNKIHPGLVVRDISGRV